MKTYPVGEAEATTRYELSTVYPPATSFGASFALHATKALNSFSAAERNTRIEITGSDAAIPLLIEDMDVFRLLNSLVQRVSTWPNSVVIVSLQNEEPRLPLFVIKLVPNLESPSNREIANLEKVQTCDRDPERALDLLLKSTIHELNNLAQSMCANLFYEPVKSKCSEIRLQLHPNYRRLALDRKYSAALSADFDGKNAKHLVIATRWPDEISRSIEALSGKFCTVTYVDNMHDVREIARCFKIDAVFIDRRTIGCINDPALFDLESFKGIATQPGQIFAYGTFRMVPASDLWTLGQIVASIGLTSNQKETVHPSYCFENVHNLTAQHQTGFSDGHLPQDLNFDLERLGELMGILKAPKFLSVSRQFLSDISKIIEIDPEETLGTTAEDYPGQFHKLGSSAGFFGAIDLRDVCYQLQDSLLLNDPLANRSSLLLFDKLAKNAAVQLKLLNELVEATA